MLAVIEHATRRIRILGATPHPTASWVVQAARNLITDLDDAGSRARFLIRDRDGKLSGLFDTVLADAPLRPLSDPIADPERIAQLGVRRRDRLGGTLHEYRHAA